jgi:hypothetical protein
VIAPIAAALLALQAASWDDELPEYVEQRPHVQLSLWGGGATLLDRGGGTTPFLGAEAGWLFSQQTLSLLFDAHRYGADLSTRTWTPVALVRLEQRFETQRGLEAALVVGIGAGKPERSWIAWYQFGLGVRLLLGDPFFVKGELGFERDNFFRFGGAVGLSF